MEELFSQLIQSKFIQQGEWVFVVFWAILPLIFLVLLFKTKEGSACNILSYGITGAFVGAVLTLTLIFLLGFFGGEAGGYGAAFLGLITMPPAMVIGSCWGIRHGLKARHTGIEKTKNTDE